MTVPAPRPGSSPPSNRTVQARWTGPWPRRTHPALPLRRRLGEASSACTSSAPNQASVQDSAANGSFAGYHQARAVGDPGAPSRCSTIAYLTKRHRGLDLDRGHSAQSVFLAILILTLVI